MNRNLLLLAFVIAFSGYDLNAQTQVTDLPYQDGDRSSAPSGYIIFKDLIFFNANTNSEGNEIWVSDGTIGNTRLLKDIAPGNASGSTNFSRSTVVLNGSLFFMANDGQNGNQLWSTDGTEQNTKQITSLPNLNVSQFTLVNDQIFFLLRANNRLQVWKSDGTAQGTVMVKGGLPIWNSPSFEGTANGLFYFTFQPEGGNDSRVWRSDGTDSGTFPITPLVDGNGAGAGGTSDLTQYIEFNNEFYFVVRSSGYFPWPTTVGIIKTDGTAENTLPVKAVYNGSTKLIDLADVIEVNGKLYFSFFEADTYRLIIWESDGTPDGTTFIYDEFGSKYYSSSNLSSDGNDLIFLGKNDNSETSLLRLKLDTYEVIEIKELFKDAKKPFINFDSFARIERIGDNYLIKRSRFEEELEWFSDLTTTNTVPIGRPAQIREIITYKGNVFFTGLTQEEGFELWKSDFSFLNPELLLNINSTNIGLRFWALTILDNKIFFGANTKENGDEPWVYDNSTGEVSLVKDIYSGPDPSLPLSSVKYGDFAYFSAFNPELGRELWRSDGTEAGTTLVVDLAEGSTSSSVTAWAVSQGLLFFQATIDGSHYLYQTDGTNTVQIKEFESVSRIRSMVSSDNDLFFNLENALWKSDGTESGTIKIKDFYLLKYLTLIGTDIFFTAQESFGGESELWFSDGTIAGTKMVKDIGTGYSSEPEKLIHYNDQLVFTAFTEESGREYWKSDGTTAGTVMITDINPGPIRSAASLLNTGINPRGSYATYNGLLYFSANDGISGFEVWRTDGTSAGTKQVEDINPGPIGSFPREFASNEAKIYFTAYSPSSGMELWSSEGTASSTSQLFDIFKGVEGSLPARYMFLDNELFFIAETENSGLQLWRAGQDQVTGIEDLSREQVFQLYPNPATNYIYVNGENRSFKNWKIFNLQGQRIPIRSDSPGQIYVGDLPVGVYILKGESAKEKVIRKFFKR